MSSVEYCLYNGLATNFRKLGEFIVNDALPGGIEITLRGLNIDRGTKSSTSFVLWGRVRFVPRDFREELFL